MVLKVLQALLERLDTVERAVIRAFQASPACLDTPESTVPRALRATPGPLDTPGRAVIPAAQARTGPTARQVCLVTAARTGPTALLVILERQATRALRAKMGPTELQEFQATAERAVILVKTELRARLARPERQGIVEQALRAIRAILGLLARPERAALPATQALQACLERPVRAARQVSAA